MDEKKKETNIRVLDEARLIVKDTCKKMGVEMTPAISRALVRVSQEKPDFFLPQNRSHVINETSN